MSQTSGTLHTVSAMPVRELLGLPCGSGGGGGASSFDDGGSSIVDNDSVETVGNDGFAVSSPLPAVAVQGDFNNNNDLSNNDSQSNDKSVDSFGNFGNNQDSLSMSSSSSNRKRSSAMSKGSKRRSTFKTGTNNNNTNAGKNSSNHHNNNSSSNNNNNNNNNNNGGGKLKLDYCELGPCELVILSAVLRRNALLPKPVRDTFPLLISPHVCIYHHSLFLSPNMSYLCSFPSICIKNK
jgi:hypothetical protein